MHQPTTDDYIRQLQDSDKDIRRNAAWRLGRVRDITVITPLLDALHDSEAEVRVRVAEALSGQRDPRIAPAVMDALQTEADHDTRVQLIRTLGYQDAPEAVSMLEPLLEADTTSENRSAAAAPLGELHAFASPDTLRRLVSTLSTEAEIVTRHQIAQTLQRIGGSEVSTALAQALHPALDEAVQLQMIELLGLLGNTSDMAARDALQPFMDSPFDSVRETAEWAFSRLH